MSCISDPYVIATLPRTNFSGELQQCYVSDVADNDTNYIDIGISGSLVGTYILKPTPKLIWSHAISPSTIVTAISSVSTSEGSTRIAVGLTERNKNKLRLIQRDPANNQTENEGFLLDSEDVKFIDIKVAHRIVGLNVSKASGLVHVLLSNGETSTYNFAIDEISLPVHCIKGNKKAKIIYHKFIQDIVGTKISNVEGYLLSVDISSSPSFATVKIMAFLHNHEIVEVSQANIDISSKDIAFQYDPVGSLLLFDNMTQVLSIYRLPIGQLNKTLPLSGRFRDLIHKGDVGNRACLEVPAPHRVLIATGETIFLIDTKFEAVLSTFTMNKASLPNFASCVFVNGNSLRTQETSFLALVTDTRDGLTSIRNFSCNVGLGTLSECLGKGIKRVQKKTQSDEEFFQNEVTGLSSFVGENDDEQFFLENSTLKNELFEVFNLLKSCKKSHDIQRWEHVFLSYCKGYSLKEILDGKDSSEKNESQEFQIFELEKDRVIDSRFFYKIASLIFTKNEEKQIVLLSADFVPEKTLTYLLTHPLFPMEFSNGLLQSLHKFPRLVRQAIVTCPNLSCFELIQQLNLIENDDIFKDVIVRVSEDYSAERITLETRKIMSTNNEKKRKSLQTIFNLDKIISKIIKLNFGFEILNSFIDSNGLILSVHYSKNEEDLDKLTHKIEKKMDSLFANSQLLTLVEQSLVNAVDAGTNASSKSKKKKAKQQKQQALKDKEQKKLKPLTISEEVDDTKVKLESMLSIDKSRNVNEVLIHNKNNNVYDQLNKKVPSYSINKLIL